MILKYYMTLNGKTSLLTEIFADYKTQTVSIINHTDNLLFRAFGVNETPTWDDYNHFLEERCFPRTRANCRDLLEAYGLGNIGYEPIEIIKKTGGRMAEDPMFLVVEE